MEIGEWVEMTEPGRLALMAELPARFTQSADLRAARRSFDEQMLARVRTRRRSRT